jgi:hypothetical protein
MKHPVQILVTNGNDSSESIMITMQYGQTIDDLISELVNTYGPCWRNVRIANIHDKQFPENMPLRGDMVVRALKEN